MLDPLRAPLAMGAPSEAHAPRYASEAVALTCTASLCTPGTPTPIKYYKRKVIELETSADNRSGYKGVGYVPRG